MYAEHWAFLFGSQVIFKVQVTINWAIWPISSCLVEWSHHRQPSTSNHGHQFLGLILSLLSTATPHRCKRHRYHLLFPHSALVLQGYPRVSETFNRHFLIVNRSSEHSSSSSSRLLNFIFSESEMANSCFFLSCFLEQQKGCKLHKGRASRSHRTSWSWCWGHSWGPEKSWWGMLSGFFFFFKCSTKF